MMNPNVLKNLTLASAKHLVSQGHITKDHHAKIIKSLKKPGMVPMAPKAPAAGMAAKMAPGPAPMAPPKMGKMGMGAPAPVNPAQMEVPMGALDAQQGPSMPWEG